MDSRTPLKIKRHTSLLLRFPECRNYGPIHRKKAQWIVFSKYLSPSHFDDIDFFTNQYNAVLDIWKVGQYEVALMSGVLTQEHQKILDALKLDYALITDIPDLTSPGVIVFDMDSTAIQIECIDEIAKLAGVGDSVSEITERAMQGELDFEESLRARVAQLKGADEFILSQVRKTLPLMPDLTVLIEALQSYGWKTAIASGGFTYFSDHLKEMLELDFAQSNKLEIVDGKLTGNVLGDIVSAQTKADILHQLAEEYDIETHNTVAVGDGANDLAMMEAAGLGIAYHAKPKVNEAAQTSVKYSGLGGVLCILSARLAVQQKVSW
jgi:phosphoserine phosphatase